MDELIKQISQMIKTRDVIDENTALAKAVREIVLSGLSRCGFMKVCSYLEKLDHFNQNTLYLCFLNQGCELSLNETLHAVKYELDAAGIHNDIKKLEQGFTVEYNPVKVCVFIYQKDFDLHSVFLYQQQPIPYELRSIISMNEGIRSEIERSLEEFISSCDAGNKKNKKETPKSSGRKKKTKEIDQNLQPSLFDF